MVEADATITVVDATAHVINIQLPWLRWLPGYATPCYWERHCRGVLMLIGPSPRRAR